MAKTKEELNALKAEVETLNSKLRELTDEELEQVAGGFGAWGGSDVMSVITAPGQFEAYLSGAYTQRLGTDMPEVERAVTD